MELLITTVLPLVLPGTISILIKVGTLEKISYERRAYESVDI